MPSPRSRATAATAALLRLRDRQFDPDRFTVPAPPDAPKYNPPPRLARRVTIERQEVEGWPMFTLTAPGGRDADGQVHYLHGGAHAAEIHPVHWMFAAKFAVRTGRTVTVPIYPLVPAATHP